MRLRLCSYARFFAADLLERIQGAGTEAKGNTRPAAKTAHTAQEDGAGGSAAQG